MRPHPGWRTAASLGGRRTRRSCWPTQMSCDLNRYRAGSHARVKGERDSRRGSRRRACTGVLSLAPRRAGDAAECVRFQRQMVINSKRAAACRVVTAQRARVPMAYANLTCTAPDTQVASSLLVRRRRRRNERRLNGGTRKTAKKNPAFAGFSRLRGKRGVLFRVFGGRRSLGSARQPLTVE